MDILDSQGFPVRGLGSFQDEDAACDHRGGKGRGEEREGDVRGLRNRRGGERGEGSAGEKGKGVAPGPHSAETLSSASLHTPQKTLFA